MNKIISLFLLISVLSVTDLPGQDIHFTNYRMAPLHVNPALTGAFYGSYRISGLYRDQWSGIADINGYRSPHLSIDLPVLPGILMENDWIGVGLAISRSTVGVSNFRHTLAGMSISYHLGFDPNYKQVLSIGGQYGASSNDFDNDPSKLTTLGELHGMGEEIFTGGNGQRTQGVSGGGLSLGVAYKSVMNRKGDLWRVGVSMNGIGSSKGSHVQSRDFAIADSTDTFSKPTIRALYEMSFLMNKDVRINPSLYFQKNGASNSFVAQGTMDYLFNRKKQIVLTGGLGYRLGDAAQILAGASYKDIKVMLSYDLTLSGFSPAGAGGAFEIAVQYVGKVYKKPDVFPVIFCPRL